MKIQNHTAQLIDGESFRRPEREEKSTITQASNSPVPLEIGILLLLVWLSLAFLLAWFGGEMAGAPRSARLVLFGVLATIAAIPTMLIISGDASALFESWQNAQTDRAWADVESERIEAQRQVLIAQLDNAQQLQAQQHDEAMKRLDDHGSTQQLLGRLAHVEQSIRDGRAIAQNVSRETFTPAVPDPARDAARKFVGQCYTDTGYNDAIVYKNGGLRYGPWNREWAGESWAENAKQLLIDCVLEGPANQYRLRFDNVVDADNALIR